MVTGTAMVAASVFKSSIYMIHFGTLAISSYAGVFVLALNLLVLIALTLICDSTGMKRLADITSLEGYYEYAVAFAR